tara:strand:+ start:53991 stop:55472 length:1482 start_codon:yes stop_codon:yes gene_type:complete
MNQKNREINIPRNWAKGSKVVKTILLAAFVGFGFQNSSHASAGKAWDVLVRSKGSVKYYPQVVNELLKDELYFTSIPYLKEYLSVHKGRLPKEVDSLVDRVVTKVGVRQFEVLPTSILKRTSAPVIKYILAKKQFRVGRYKKALQTLNGTIPGNHPVKPFALMLEGTIFSIEGDGKNARASFQNCIETTKSEMNNTSDENRLRQLAINRDYCTVGVARSEFEDKKFDDASLSYLDLPKDSYVWPEILFEEAWNSFYLRDYNRTLGKLVTYKAPILNFVFNPEVDVLKALTYMELCLFDDAKKVVDDFYNEYQTDSLAVKKFLEKYGRNYKYFYLLAKSRTNGKSGGSRLLNKLIDTTLKDAAFIELIDSFNIGRDEIEQVKGISNSRMRKVFTTNLREALLLQRDLIGAYVRKNLHLYVSQLDKSFEGMTYIKLEVLGRKKQRVYSYNSFGKRNRGDIKYLQRNEKQYFWSFNGEFWADELGDYVFSLKSECE